ncbi:hypothetical protein D9M72_518610 [compost metagenome]
MDDQLGALDELEELVGDVLEARLAHQEFVGDAVYRDGAFIHLAVRLQVNVEVPPGQATAFHLDAADLDDTVAIGDRHAGGFSVQYYITHVQNL